MTYTLEQLQAGEALALQLRNDYKNKLALRPELTINKIVFPPIHIQEDDDILRYGMCWLYNGFAILTPEHGLMVDPGIDFSYRWLKAKYPVTRCDSIIVTHQHIDHGGGVTALLEWLLRARKMVNLLLTQETIDEGNIPKYYLGNSPERASHNVMILKDNNSYDLGAIQLETIQHYHGIACYGFTLSVAGKKIVHISDTGYATKVKDEEGEKLVGKEKIIGRSVIIEKHNDLREKIHGADIAIINIEQLEYGKNSFTHTSVRDVIDMVKDNDVKKLIVTHINPCGQYTQEWMQGLQEFVQAETNVETIIPGREGIEIEF